MEDKKDNSTVNVDSKWGLDVQFGPQNIGPINQSITGPFKGTLFLLFGLVLVSVLCW